MTAATAPAAWIYDNRTTHTRFTPFRRRFSYQIAHLFLDIDRVSDAAQALRLFSYNGPGLFSFHDRDHGDRSGRPLREWAERMFADADISIEGGPIRLLTFPRVLGHVFNPISVFYGYGPGGDLRGVIYEVHSTFDKWHIYVVRATPEGGRVRHNAEKRFYVSPFMDVRGHYAFDLNVPGDEYHLAIANMLDGKCEHRATLRGRRRTLSDAALMGNFLRLPLMTLGSFAAIHWQALWIWLKGARYRDPPTPTHVANPPVVGVEAPPEMLLAPTGKRRSYVSN